MPDIRIEVEAEEDFEMVCVHCGDELKSEHSSYDVGDTIELDTHCSCYKELKKELEAIRS